MKCKQLDYSGCCLHCPPVPEVQRSVCSWYDLCFQLTPLASVILQLLPFIRRERIGRKEEMRRERTLLFHIDMMVMFYSSTARSLLLTGFMVSSLVPTILISLYQLYISYSQVCCSMLYVIDPLFSPWPLQQTGCIIKTLTLHEMVCGIYIRSTTCLRLPVFLLLRSSYSVASVVLLLVYN